MGLLPVQVGRALVETLISLLDDLGDQVSIEKVPAHTTNKDGLASRISLEGNRGIALADKFAKQGPAAAVRGSPVQAQLWDLTRAMTWYSWARMFASRWQADTAT